VQVPEMLTVVVAHPSRFDAKAASVDDSAARKVRGVVDVKVIPQGVAVYATGFWAAKKGRDALTITWDETDTETRSTDQLLVEYRSQAKQQAVTATHRGNVESAFGKAAKIIQAEYVFPYLAHAPLEPLDCTIAMNNGCKPSIT
jgi:isoquinoline 1-oxidoreductase beta subunit